MGSSPAALTAVIAAAGSGERLGAGGPKAFVPLAGKPMIEWSLAALRACDAVAAIVVAAPPGHAHGLEADAGEGEGAPLIVVDGGATRCHSVANALAAVRSPLVAVHDAARPLLTPELLEALLARLEADPEAAAAIAAAPVTDTVKRANLPSCSFCSDSDQKEQLTVVEETLDRSRLWAAQTPQLFRTEALRAALAVPEEQREAATDEAMLIEQAGGRVLIHPVTEPNLKVTTPLDLRVAEMLLRE